MSTTESHSEGLSNQVARRLAPERMVRCTVHRLDASEEDGST